MILKKSVVLRGVDNSLKKAVLNFDAQTGSVLGDVKLYNFPEEPVGVLSLALMVDGKVHKVGLTRVGYMDYRFGSILKQIPSECSCAVVNLQNGGLKPLLLGAMDSSRTLEQSLVENLELLNEPSMQKTKDTLDKTLGEYEYQKELEEEIDKAMEHSCQNSCQNCQYKHAFYETTSENIESALQFDGTLKNEIIKGKMRVPEHKDGINFIDEIAEQIKGLFEGYPREEALEAIIPNSKWVKIDFNGDSKYYVVGLISENGDIKYICYGIPGVWAEVPPEDFNSEAQFLPLDLDDPDGAGYWITYQDAFNGDLVAVNVI